MKLCKGFTLAEALIVLTVVGIVACLSLPSVISNTQQLEYKTGLRKAVSVLNQAIALNIQDGQSPYENTDLYNYLQKHLSIQKRGILPYLSTYNRDNGQEINRGQNYAFYTTDGMRFEFDDDGVVYNHLKLHESSYTACVATVGDLSNGRVDNVSGSQYSYYGTCGGCGSLGLSQNPKHTTKPPCAVLVDVNGDRKPTPSNIYYGNDVRVDYHPELKDKIPSKKRNQYNVPDPDKNRVTDIFTILITEDKAIPYGIVAQRAMYQAPRRGSK